MQTDTPPYTLHRSHGTNEPAAFLGEQRGLLSSLAPLRLWIRICLPGLPHVKQVDVVFRHGKIGLVGERLR